MGRTDVPLNNKGEEQARDLAEAMKNFPLDGVYSSPQLRARQTAEALAAAHGLQVRVEPSLAEVEFGRWTGIGWEDLLKDPEYEVWLNEPRPAEKHFFEPAAEVQGRTGRFLERLTAENPEGAFALVSHSDPIRAMVNYALSSPIELFRRVRIANGSLTVIFREKEKWKLTLLNFRRDPDLRAEL